MICSNVMLVLLVAQMNATFSLYSTESSPLSPIMRRNVEGFEIRCRCLPIVEGLHGMFVIMIYKEYPEDCFPLEAD